MPSIERRSDNSYRITVSCGYDKSGKKIRKQKTVELPEGLTERQRQKELTRLSVMFEKEVEAGTYLDGEKVTLGEFSELWLRDYAEKQLAPGTLNNYRMRINERIIPALGAIRLSKLQPHHLMEFYNSLSEGGIRLDKSYIPTAALLKLLNETAPTGIARKIGLSPKTCISAAKGESVCLNTAKRISGYYKMNMEQLFKVDETKAKLSSKTIKHHHDLLSTILGTAVEWNLLASNPAQRVISPKVAKAQPKYYDDKQLVELFGRIAHEPLKYRAAILFAIDTGIRLSELAGLLWDCVKIGLKIFIR